MRKPYSISVSRLLRNSIGSLLGYCVDRKFGEPPASVHPVVWLGNGLLRLEQRTYRDTRSAGATHLGLSVAGAALLGAGAQRSLGRVAATALTTAGACAGRMLGQAATEIGTHLESDDLEAARDALPALVGRDPTTLDEHQIARAVIESVAENTVDAVTATLLAGQVGGPTGVVVHRIVNTLDAMVGHKSERYLRFGWASAHFDDLLAWVPARLTLVALMVVRPGRARIIIDTARRDAWQHPSPNGGVVEAGFAAALDIRLGGSNMYDGVVEDRGHLGDGPAPTPRDIGRAVRLANDATMLLTVAPVVLVTLYTCLHSHSFSVKFRA